MSDSLEEYLSLCKFKFEVTQLFLISGDNTLMKT